MSGTSAEVGGRGSHAKTKRRIRTEARDAYAIALVDPLESRLPLLDKMYKEYPPGQAPEPLEHLARLVKAADAYVIVSGEYNHTVPPA